VVTNLVLPLSGFLWALFVGHRTDDKLRRVEFCRSTALAALEDTWQLLLRYVVPAVVLVVFLDTSGLLELMGQF
jgi:NSS family neurotransmitter:Na+ symporter